jgi:hypothetical protein
VVGVVLVFDSEELGVVDAVESGLEIGFKWVSLEKL